MKAPGLEPMSSGEKLKKNMQKYKENGIKWYSFCFSLANLWQNVGHVKSSTDRYTPANYEPCNYFAGILILAHGIWETWLFELKKR